MPTGNQHGNRRGGIIAAAVAAVLALVGGLVLFLGMRGSSGPPEPPLERPLAATTGPATTGPSPTAASTSSASSSATKPAASPDPPPAALGQALPASDPVGLDIPAIGVQSHSLVELGLAKDGSMETPTDFGQPGWYKFGPRPGQLGPAVIAGHVDSKKGPAIFYRLGALKRGEQVKVSRKDGSVATFTIDKVARYAKAQFPTSLVYGTTTRAEIRLVTCGGAFDQSTGHYVDNIVVFGHLVA
jgi:Sortase domain